MFWFMLILFIMLGVGLWALVVKYVRAIDAIECISGARLTGYMLKLASGGVLGAALLVWFLWFLLTFN